MFKPDRRAGYQGAFPKLQPNIIGKWGEGTRRWPHLSLTEVLTEVRIRMPHPDSTAIINNAHAIVTAIGRESVDVYLFISNEFARGSILNNHLFQFLYRSFYRLDNAGLTPEFKASYFELLEEARSSTEIDLAAMARRLYLIPTRRGYRSLQFSFITKLANTVFPDYPIYDAEIARIFGFRPPSNNKSFEARLVEYLVFYRELRAYYQKLLAENTLQEPLRLFDAMYVTESRRIPPTKILDFIFWSAGKLTKGGSDAK